MTDLAVEAARIFGEWTCPGCHRWRIPSGSTASRIDAYRRHVGRCAAAAMVDGRQRRLGL